MMRIRLKKQIARICLFCLIVSAFCGAAFAAEAQGGETSPARTVNADCIPLFIDGIRVGDGILLDDTTYVSVRCFCRAMGRDVAVNWDEETAEMTVLLKRDVELLPEQAEETAAPVPEEDCVFEHKKLEMLLRPEDAYITVNGRCFYAPSGVRLVDDELLVPIRCIARAFDVEIAWQAETRSVSISSMDLDVIEAAECFYDEEDLYWLSHIIFAESGNQSIEGMIGVGNVVLNRVKDPSCPDTIYGVIFDRRYGVQFSPVETGTIYDEPNELSIVAAKLCLEGYDIAGDSLFFLNPEIGTSSWFANTRTYVATIGDHVFYA